MIDDEKPDDDFLDFDLEEDDSSDEKPEKKKEEIEDQEEDGLEIEIVDETPDDDKGKWVADDDRDGAPDEIDEDEVKEYSSKVQDRIKKLTARMHAERRAKEQAEREAQEAAGLAKRYLTETNQLKDVVEAGEKVLQKTHSESLQSALNNAKNKFKKAYEAGDEDAIVEAQEEIARTTAAMDRVSNTYLRPLPREAEVEVKPPAPSQQALLWREKNSWFGRDEVMTNYALSLHADLVKKGFQADTDPYWEAINTDISKRFSDRLPAQASRPKEEGESPKRRKSVTVAPARRRSPSARSRKVTLTDSQVRLARRLGLTNEQYAEGVLEMENNDSSNG